MVIQSELWDPAEYALLDCGDSRKLERFGAVILDRPSPAAAGLSRRSAADWSQAHARLDAAGNLLVGKVPAVEQWRVRFEELVFELKLTPFGHVGLFPEQAANWHWLRQQVAGLHTRVEEPLTALNLFAYTGGTTLTLAAAGAEVVHVDASAPAVQWARRNAEHSQLSDRPIRWIVEDARKFVTRELRRGNHYHLIVMDPPSYGHGPTGQRWSLDSDGEALVRDCLSLLKPGPGRLLFTAHSETPDARDIRQWIESELPHAVVENGRLVLGLSSERKLDAGYFVRVTL